MSIRKRNGYYYAICDCCGYELRPESTREDAIYASNLARWSFNPKTKTNTCPECAAFLRRMEDKNG